MSLFSSLKLIKDVSQGRISVVRIDKEFSGMSSSIKFLTPRPISEEAKTFKFIVSKNLIKRRTSNESALYLAP